MSRLYIGRINYRAREKDIERFFRGFGPIKEVMLKNGYGFIDFNDPRDAEDALYEMNGRELFGDRIVIEYAKGTPHGRDASRDGFRSNERYLERPYERDFRRSESPRRSCSYKVVVEPISSRAYKSDIKSHFKRCGEIDRIEIKGKIATVTFTRSKDAKYCVDKYDGTEFFGKRVTVNERRSRSRSRKSRSRRRSYASKSRSREKSSRRSPRKDSRSKSKSHSPPSVTRGDREERGRKKYSRSSDEASPEHRRNKKSKKYGDDHQKNGRRHHSDDEERKRLSSESPPRYSKENDEDGSGKEDTSKDEEQINKEFGNKPLKDSDADNDFNDENICHDNENPNLMEDDKYQNDEAGSSSHYDQHHKEKENSDSDY